MIRVKNRKVVAKLSKKSLSADRVRNLVAVFAVALTTMLFMTLFTIAGTMVHTVQQQTFRQVGSACHAFLKDLTSEQKEMLEKDPMIRESGGMLFLGVACNEPFRKVHAELSYMESGYLKRSFCQPQQGSLPQEGTKEIACDTRVLSCVGVEPQVGAELTLSYKVRGTEITDTFILSGFWEYDPAAPTSTALVPKSYVEEALADREITSEQIQEEITPETDVSGMWTLGIMLDSSMHIGEDIEKILNSHGLCAAAQSGEKNVRIGVNWAYAGAQLAARVDIQLIAAVVLLLLLTVITGYLVIYNIFQISVSRDVRFYGLLKTIGMTGRQIRHMIHIQAFLLSVAGIPLGLFAGSLTGMLLTPVLMSVLNTKRVDAVIKPWFFVIASAFSFFTVLLSCAKPGRKAAKVSPIEAVRHTDAELEVKTRKIRAHHIKMARPYLMARVNLGRNRKKTATVVASITLAVVLFQMTFTIAVGFDMDQYLQPKAVSDFILADASYFQVTKDLASPEMPSVPEEDIANIKKGVQITEDGRIYGHRAPICVYTPKDAWIRQEQSMFHTEDEKIQEKLRYMEQDVDGNPAANANVYGMEAYPLSQLQVLDGDLTDLYGKDPHAIAAVYLADDYGNPIAHSHWAKVGDTIRVHYVYEWEYFDSETGKQVTQEEAYRRQRPVRAEEKESADVVYRVAACVAMKNVMSYRSYEGFEYVMHADCFRKDSKTSDVMTWLFNTAPDHSASVQLYLEDYTNRQNPNLDFESKQTYVQAFDKLRSMFFIMGGALSATVAFISVLNFFHAMLTSIDARKREFAMLQSVGMTGRQLRQMLICEGLLYAVLAGILSLVCSFCMAPVLNRVVGSIFWFVAYRFTVLPVLLVVLIFCGIGIVLPLCCYRNMAKQTIVERLQVYE